MCLGKRVELSCSQSQPLKISAAAIDKNLDGESVSPRLRYPVAKMPVVMPLVA